MTRSKSKPLRIYELVDKGGNNPSCQSKFYGLNTRHLWHVAAVSAKQAIYLAANHEWRDDGIGPGIVEETLDGGDTPWRHDDGTESHQPRYRHKQTVLWVEPRPPEPKPTPAAKLPPVVTPEGVRNQWEFL